MNERQKVAETESPLAYSVQILADTPRKNIADDEDAAVHVEADGKIALAVLDGATGYKHISYFDNAGIAPGKFASTVAAEDFRQHGTSLSPIDAVLSMNRALQSAVKEIQLQSPDLAAEEIMQVCSALGIVAQIDTKTGILSCAYPKGDCSGLVLHADGSADWLNKSTALKAEYEALQVSLQLLEAGEITKMADLSHPRIKEVIEHFHTNANSSKPAAFGSFRGSPDEDLRPHIYARDVRLRAGDIAYLFTDGAVPFIPRAFYESDPDEGLEQGMAFQRAFVESALRKGGAAELKKQIHELEQSDPTCLNYPRLKVSDDMRIIEVRCDAEAEQSHSSSLPAWISEQAREQLLKLCEDAASDEMSSEQFQKKLIAYCTDFFWEHRQEMHMLMEGEVLASSKIQQKKGVWNNGGERDGIWIRAGMHTITAGLIAEMIAREMGLSPQIVHKAGSAGVLHDWYKKREIFETDEAERAMTEKDPNWKKTMREEGAVAITAALNRSKESDTRLLLEEGIPPDVIELAGANLLKNDAGVLTPESLSEYPETAIIPYIDGSLRDTQFISRTERMGQVFPPQSIWSLFSEGSRKDYGGRTFWEVGQALLPECFRVMAEHMKFSGTEEEFPAYLQELFVQSVRRHS